MPPRLKNTPRAPKRNFVKVGTVKIPWRSTPQGTCIDPRRLGLPRQTFVDHAAAIEAAESIARERHNTGADMLQFTAADRAVYAQIVRRVNGSAASLLDIVEAGLAVLRRPIYKTPEIAAELLASKESHDLNERYRRGLTSDVYLFAHLVPGDIGLVQPKQIESFLNSLCRPPWREPFGVRRRNHMLANIRHLFAFAIARNYLPADKTSSAHQVEVIEPPSSAAEFYAVWEIRLLLEHVREEFLPWLALNAFSGARLEEISLSRDAAKSKDPLRWEDFDWADRQIAVRPETAKTGRARRIPILDNLYAWLEPWRDRKASGPVCPKSPGNYETRRIVTKANKALACSNDTRRLVLRKNALRHSYGSYRMAIIKNEPALAYEMGNSVEMIREHYHNPRPASQALAYFQIMPDPSTNIIQLEIFR